MKSNNQVVDQLNKLLAGELTAMDQYFIHSRMYENWGFNELYERINHEMQDETSHADALIKRILFLEGVPNLSVRNPLAIGSTVPDMQVISSLKEVIAYCESVRDYVTREMLEDMLKDTEDDHTHWLEKQLGLIDRIGLENYLQSQM
jgi:bacterioferritin